MLHILRARCVRARGYDCWLQGVLLILLLLWLYVVDLFPTHLTSFSIYTFPIRPVASWYLFSSSGRISSVPSLAFLQFSVWRFCSQWLMHTSVFASFTHFVKGVPF